MSSWTSLNSSNLRKVRHDPETRTLHVQFSNGAVHKYADVPVEEFSALLDANSHGSYFHNYIKNNYRHERA